MVVTKLRLVARLATLCVLVCSAMLAMLAMLAPRSSYAQEADDPSLEEEQAAMEASDEGEAPETGASESGSSENAQDGDAGVPDDEGTGGGDVIGPVSEEPALLSDEQADMEDQAPPEEAEDTLDPFEAENADYFFLGAFVRFMVVPQFIQDLFVDEGTTGFNPGVGAEFTYRRNQFNISVDAWWTNAAASGFYRANGDPASETEWLDIELMVFFVNASFMWAFPLTDWFAIELGFDLGVGFVAGSLTRTEAYPDGDGFEQCTGPGNPNPSFCEPNVAPDPCYDTNGGHYNCQEPNWFTEGGDVPFVIPWVALPRLAARFKPIHQLQIRVDAGFGLYNFFFGLGAAFGF